MLDIGFPELLVIAVVLILVVGPKDLPPMLRAFGKTVKKYRGMATDFKNQFNEALEESELDELRQAASDVKNMNPMNKLKDAVNPLAEVGEDIKSHLDVKDEDLAPVKPWKPKPEEISDVARSVGEKEKAAKAAAAKKTTSSTRKPRTSTAKSSTAATSKARASKAKAAAAKPAAAKPATASTSKPAAAKKPATRKAATAKTATAKASTAKASTAKSSVSKTTRAKNTSAKPKANTSKADNS
ncbi:MAG: twin-arginine translocase subunit TatB [Rhizobiaceae bacterium]|nr:twin-arginine translocase subunit TatB [Rhizobiaceae bacterium]